MGKEKGGFLTPKAIANRIKAKGLQKLRWYCQMCQKQCRDENGFKCHSMSESHQRQMLLVAENCDKFVDQFSKDFCDDFLLLLRHRFGTKRVHANIVYQEYIANREHIHMNSTQWETLTDLVKWLGKEGLCVSDETEKGWFVQYVDRDPKTIARQEAVLKKEKMDMDDEEKKARFIQLQIERARQEKEPEASNFTDLQRENEEEKIIFKLPTTAASKSAGVSSVTSIPSTSNRLEIESKEKEVKNGKSSKDESPEGGASSSKTSRKRKSALEEIIEMESSKKEKIGRKDYWLHPGIVVKIMTRKLGEKYYKEKGVVTEVIDRYGAVVRMLDSGDKLKVDQMHVETVIPAAGRSVLIVNGAYRGQHAVFQAVDIDRFSCTVCLQAGVEKGRVVEGIQYEDVCKLDS